MKIRYLLGALLLCAGNLVQAQGTASPTKKELVQKLLALQQPGSKAPRATSSSDRPRN